MILAAERRGRGTVGMEVLGLLIIAAIAVGGALAAAGISDTPGVG